MYKIHKRVFKKIEKNRYLSLDKRERERKGKKTETDIQRDR
jgi:hypothetical protein